MKNRRLAVLLASGATIALAAVFAPSAVASARPATLSGVVPGTLVHLLGPPANQQASSTNWAGYAAYNDVFTDVLGT